MKKIIVLLIVLVLIFLILEIHPLVQFMLQNPDQIDDIFKSIFVTGGFGIFTD